MKGANVFYLNAVKPSPAKTGAPKAKAVPGADAPAFSAMMHASYAMDTPRQQTNAQAAQTVQTAESQPADYDRYQYRGSALVQAQESPAADRISAEAGAADRFAEAAVETVAGELDVDESEVRAAMEALGLTAFDLLNPQKLAVLAAELTGAADGMELVCNPQFTGLMQAMQTLGGELMEELGLKPEQMREFAAQSGGTDFGKVQEPKLSVSDAEPNIAGAAKPTVSGEGKDAEVNAGGSTVRDTAAAQSTQAVSQEKPQESEESVQNAQAAWKKPEEAGQNAQAVSQEKPEAGRNAQAVSQEKPEAGQDGQAALQKPEEAVQNATAVLQDEPTDTQAVLQEKPEAAQAVSQEKPTEIAQGAQADVQKPEEAAEKTVSGQAENDSVFAGEKEPKAMTEEPVIQENDAKENGGQKAGQEPAGSEAERQPKESVQQSGESIRTAGRTTRAAVQEPAAGAQQLFRETFAQAVTETAAADRAYMSDETMDIIEQVARNLKLSISEGVSSLEMTLNPEHLGKVYIQISAREGAVHAQIAAANEAVKQALELQTAELQENLSQAGVRVEAIEVTVASHEFERNLEQNQKRDEQQGEHAQQNGGRRRNLNLSSLDSLSGLMSEEEALAAQIMRDNGNSVDLSA